MCVSTYIHIWLNTFIECLAKLKTRARLPDSLCKVPRPLQFSKNFNVRTEQSKHYIITPGPGDRNRWRSKFYQLWGLQGDPIAFKSHHGFNFPHSNELLSKRRTKNDDLHIVIDTAVASYLKSLQERSGRAFTCAHQDFHALIQLKKCTRSTSGAFGHEFEEFRAGIYMNVSFNST